MGLSKIKIARLRKGLRQWDVAQRLGIAESYLSKIETGRMRPSPELLEKIAAALEVPLVAVEENENETECQGAD